MKRPSGFAGVTQFAVENACTAETMNRKMTMSLTATMMSLKRADSRMPITSSHVMTTITTIAGTLRMAPVAEQLGPAAAEVSGAETNPAAKFGPKAFSKLSTYPDQPIATAI